MDLFDTFSVAEEDGSPLINFGDTNDREFLLGEEIDCRDDSAGFSEAATLVGGLDALALVVFDLRVPFSA